ncbi:MULTISPECIES: DUF3545 family protein [unclassified Pseudoalteromonas]|uniref:DUF3545 family protein n=1 Tax=unclassified Pseudoalteromonas TaxID=194690 RepID=UPI0030152B30
MDTLDELMQVLESPEARKKTSSKGKKRKWREIEALKDKQRLRKELQELDIFAESVDIDELEF